MRSRFDEQLMVLNHKIWQWYKRNDAIAEVYNELWEKADLYACENLKGEELKNAIKEEVRKKDNDLTGNMLSQGTTPRRLTDLIGSLCDLTSGSGDKGTPVVFIQGYFDNYASEEE
mgnify:CR=1 FL=1